MAGSEAEITLVMRAKNLASREVDRLHGSLLKARSGAGALMGGLVDLAKIGLFGVIGAATAFAGAIAYATKQAADEQIGIERLQAALKANVKGFDGNTAAIEALISKREALAFSDDDLRNSLTVLVAKYHDVKKAEDLQATAMDIARLKGISLQDATLLLTKGLDGSSKVLKQLGIDLPKTATQQERLTAIQKVAAGQADAYGKSAKGAMEAFQISMGDVVEDIGSAFLPIMTQAFTFLRSDAIPAIRGVIGSVSAWINQNRPMLEQIRQWYQVYLSNLIAFLGRVVAWVRSVIDAIANNTDAMNVIRTAIAGVVEGLQLLVAAAASVIGIISTLWQNITSNKPLMAAFGAAFDIIARAVRGVVDAIRSVISLGQSAIHTLTHLTDIKLPDLSGLIPHFAEGGWVGLKGPQLAVLGERGPEYVVPNHQLGRAMGGPGGGGPITTIVQIDGREIARQVDRYAYHEARRSPATTQRS